MISSCRITAITTKWQFSCSKCLFYTPNREENRVLLFIRSNSSRTKSLFSEHKPRFGLGQSWSWVSMASTRARQASGEFLYGRPCSPSRKDWIQLRAFPQSSIKSSQPEAAKLLLLPVRVAVTTSLKSLQQLLLETKIMSGLRLPGRIRRGPNPSFVPATGGLRWRNPHHMGHLTLAWNSWCG